MCHWITLSWVDKEGNEAPSSFRITHALIRANSEWRIISGMSMREPKPAAK